ncbi:hypothetical protein VTI28DRAFT_3141 [Corynascus sepedonium]
MLAPGAPASSQSLAEKEVQLASSCMCMHEEAALNGLPADEYLCRSGDEELRRAHACYMQAGSMFGVPTITE